MKYPVLCPECADTFRTFARGTGGINACFHPPHNTPEAGVYFCVIPLIEGGHTCHIVSPISLQEAEAMRDEALSDLEPVAAH